MSRGRVVARGQGPVKGAPSGQPRPWTHPTRRPAIQYGRGARVQTPDGLGTVEHCDEERVIVSLFGAPPPVGGGKPATSYPLAQIARLNGHA